MAEKDRRRDTTQTRHASETLEFERPIVELETKISELEALSESTELNLNGEIKPLKARLDRLIDEVFRNLSAWEEVRVARLQGRPLATDFLEGMCDEWLELHGDRAFRDDPAILTALARIGDRRVLVVAHRKGRDYKQRIAYNFGCAHPEGYRKALLKMRLAEKFRLPVVSLINTPGAYPGIGAEERGQAWAIAENLMAMCSLRVPIICIVIGEGGSGGALGIGIGDRVLMLEHAYYSVISPEGCAAILWKDATRAPDAAAALRLSARDLESLGVVDEILEESRGAAHRDAVGTIEHTKRCVLEHIDELERISMDELLQARYEKFRAMGTLFGDPSQDEEVQEDAPEEEEAAAKDQEEPPREG